MSVPTNIDKALVVCKGCPHAPPLSLACETNSCPDNNVIGYIADAPDDEDACTTCIQSDHCPTHEEDRCECYRDDDEQ